MGAWDPAGDLEVKDGIGNSTMPSQRPRGWQGGTVCAQHTWDTAQEGTKGGGTSMDSWSMGG